MDIQVLEERDGWLYLLKPAGLPVFPPHDGSGGSVLEALGDLRPDLRDLPWPAGFEGGIAHRLDTATSGLLVCATTLDGLAALRRQFQEKVLVKTYRFLTDRQVPWTSHTVTVDLAHDARRRSRMVPRRGANTPHRGAWLPARTELERLPDGTWEARMRTGVMHQIRLHAAFVGLALLGDRLYGGASQRPGMEADFMLHHVGIVGPDWRSPRAPVPAWWAGVQP